MDAAALAIQDMAIPVDAASIKRAKSYGVGIDVHSKTIEVRVRVFVELDTVEFRREFNTDWNSLVTAREWAVGIITKRSSPIPNDILPLHYTLEATSTYHLPVIMAFGGTPSIINPILAGYTKQKTDILDARNLSYQDTIGLWRQTYIPSEEVEELRMIIAQRNNQNRLAGRIGAHIHNNVLRFGITAGRNGSVTRRKAVRAEIERFIDGYRIESADTVRFPFMPESVRGAFTQCYKEFDIFDSMTKIYTKQMVDKARSMQWETKNGSISGDQMISLLKTAPGIGEYTAVVWLAYIITPLRFSNGKAIAAYCGLDPSLQVSAKKITGSKKRGGCRVLHYTLCNDASNLLRHHNELFGQWGYTIYKRTGRWKKATNAVARKLAVSLYHMQMNGVPFSYDKYRLLSAADVMDIDLSTLVQVNPEFKRYIKILVPNGIITTQGMVTQYYNCNLHSYRGLGKKFFGLVKDFIDNQKRYRGLLAELIVK